MPSSDRVLLRRRTAEPAAGPAPRHDAPAAASPAGGSLLRGRPGRSERPAGEVSAQTQPRADHQRQLSASTSLAALANAGALGPELRQMQRIAEERGYAHGRARAEAELRAAIDALDLLTERLEAAAPRETTAIAHAIAELSLAVARRVVQHEVQLDPSVLCSSLEDAVQTINGSPEAHVFLHPDAVEVVRLAWEARHGLSHLGKRWTFEADPNLPPGGCRLRYDHGFVDAGFEAQIEEIGIALDRAIPGFVSSPSAEEDVA